MNFNKVFAAILVAAIVAMLAGFIARETVQAEAPEKNSFSIAVTDDAGAGGAAAVAKPDPILGLLAKADATKGQDFAKACGACHSFGKGEAARVGPNLYGIIGAKHAHMEGFAYSDAMKALHDGPAWGYAELNIFLWNPQKHVPGTKMTFAGIKKTDQRADVIAWLRTLADSPAPLPDQAAIDAEAKELAPAAAATPAPGDKAAAAKDSKKAEDKAATKTPSDKKDTTKAASPSTSKPAETK